MAALNKLKEDGKIRFIGVSNYTQDMMEEAMRYAKLQQIKKEAKNVKQKYNISGDSKDKLAYVDFDIMIVGGKEYVGKEEEW